MTTTTVYSVPDISCDHCVQAITAEVSAVDGVTQVLVDLASKTVAVSGGASGDVVAAIDEAGFDASIVDQDAPTADPPG